MAQTLNILKIEVYPRPKKNMRTRHQQKVDRLSCSVSGSLGLMYKLGRLGGVAPVHFECKRNKRTMTVSPIVWIVFCFICTVFDVLCLLGVVIDLNVDPELSSRARMPTSRRLVWVHELAMTMITSSILVYGGLRRIKRTIKSHHQLQNIHDLLNDKEIQVEWMTHALIFFTKVLIIFMLTASYHSFINSVVANGRDLLSAVLYLFYHVGYVPLPFTRIQFTIVVLESRKTISLLNDRFENIFQMQCDRFNARTNHENIRHLSSLYDKVFDVIRDINKTYELEAIILLNYAFFELILNQYNLIVNIKSQTMHLSLLLLELIWTLVNWVGIAAIVEPCHRTQQEINRTKLLVSKFIINSSDDQVSAELEKFFRFLTLNELSYAPFGICTISRSLIATIAGSVTTYLVMLVQFQGPDRGEY